MDSKEILDTQNTGSRDLGFPNNFGKGGCNIPSQWPTRVPAPGKVLRVMIRGLSSGRRFCIAFLEAVDITDSISRGLDI